MIDRFDSGGTGSPWRRGKAPPAPRACPPGELLSMDSTHLTVKHLTVGGFTPKMGLEHLKYLWGEEFPKMVHPKSSMSGWWLGHPSEKHEFVNWDD